MDCTIRLRTLGDCAIEVGETRIGPDSTVLFALLLYLAIERSRPVPRARLRELLWPTIPEEKAWHSLRQLLYRIRKLGVEIEAKAGHVRLVGEVEADYERVESGGNSQVLVESSLEEATFLESYSPRISTSLSEWLDETRAVIHTRLRHALQVAIIDRRQRGEWQLVDRLSRWILRLDPYNEEATLALAEAMALTGSKRAAVEMLDRYAAELAIGSARNLTLPSTVLRRRIAERLPEASEAGLLLGPFVGRGDALSFLQRGLARAKTRHSETCHIWGPAGIGKTRLLDEFSRIAVLGGVKIERVICRASDKTRPMSLFADLVPRLIRLPGALGCLPEKLKLLNRLASCPADSFASSGQAGEADFLAAHIRGAILDLVDAVSQEQPLALVVEDTHSADEHSLSLLWEISQWAEQRPVLIVRSSRQPPDCAGIVASYRLEPLSASDIRTLVAALAQASRSSLRPDDLERLVQLSEGNPFYARELVTHWNATRTLTSFPASLTTLVNARLRALEPSAALTLQTIALLDGCAAPHIVELALGYPTHVVATSLQELELAGLVSIRGGLVTCAHDIIAEAAVAGLGELATGSIHRAIARSLESEAAHHTPPAFVWECARHWQLGGKPDRALDFGIQCARQLASLGLSRDAASILERLQPLCRGDECREVELLQLKAAAHYQAQEWNDVIAALQTRRRLAPQSATGLRTHDVEELMLLEASWRSDPVSYEPLLSQGQECVRCLSASATHRLAAAIECLKMAGNVCDAVTSAAIYEELRQISSQGDNDAALHAEAAMIFHTLFGDVQRGAEAASQLVTLRKAQFRPAALFGTLLNAGFPLLFGGRVDDGRAVLVEALHIAKQHRLDAAMFVAYDNLVVFSLRADDYASAEAWFHEAEPHLTRAPALQRIAFEACGVEILLAHGRTVDAMARWQRISDSTIPENFPRGVAALESVRTRVQLAAGSSGVADEQLTLLHSLHMKLRGLGGHDRVALALFQAMDARGQRDQAAQLYGEYVANHRRERLPLPTALAHLGVQLNSERHSGNGSRGISAEGKPLFDLHRTAAIEFRSVGYQPDNA